MWRVARDVALKPTELPTKLRGHSIKSARLGNFLHLNDNGIFLSRWKSSSCGGKAKLIEIYVLAKDCKQFATAIEAIYIGRQGRERVV